VKPAFEKYKNIGVRIEDDMLITPTGVEWMTKALPHRSHRGLYGKSLERVTICGWEVTSV
jgi:hypothetical protein